MYKITRKMYKITRQDNSVFFFQTQAGLSAAEVSDRIKACDYTIENDYTRISVTPC